MSFLLVGHTHEDVDQCFSKISQKLKEKDALTIPNLEALILTHRLHNRMFPKLTLSGTFLVG